MPENIFKDSPQNVAYYFSGLNFPCSKQDLINAATNNNAPDNILDFINKMPDMTYYSMADIVKGVGEVG